MHTLAERHDRIVHRDDTGINGKSAKYPDIVKRPITASITAPYKPQTRIGDAPCVWGNIHNGMGHQRHAAGVCDHIKPFCTVKCLYLTVTACTLNEFMIEFQHDEITDRRIERRTFQCYLFRLIIVGVGSRIEDCKWSDHWKSNVLLAWIVKVPYIRWTSGNQYSGPFKRWSDTTC